MLRGKLLAVDRQQGQHNAEPEQIDEDGQKNDEQRAVLSRRGFVVCIHGMGDSRKIKSAKDSRSGERR